MRTFGKRMKKAFPALLALVSLATLPCFAAAPSWFTGMADDTWMAVAGATGQRITDVLPNPVPHTGLSGENPNAITLAWCGGAVDQGRGEYLLCGNGGHADYPGNEGYALSMRSETPAWRRLSDPTPNGNMGDVMNEGGGIYADGRPRSMHASFECFGDGRVWHMLQNSVTSGGGGSVDGIVAYNRETIGTRTTPLPWTASNLGPWELYGSVSPKFYLGIYIFGVAAFDPVDHKMWGLGGNGAGNTPYWSIGTGPSNLGVKNSYASNQSFGHWGGWACVAPELRILIAGDHYRKTICVLDLKTITWTQVSNVTGTGLYEGGSGGVYLAGNKTIAVGLPRDSGRTINWLKIPTTAAGAYDPVGQWVWTNTTPSGPAMTSPLRNAGAYSKWNIIEDMGNGQSAIVYVNQIDGPTYVYKVPPSGSAAEKQRALARNSMSLLPNPVTSGAKMQVTLASGIGHSELRIYDLRGRMVENISAGPAQKSAFVDTKNLHAGVYLLRAADGSRENAVRFVVQK